MRDIIKDMINNYFIIFTGCMAGTWIFCMLFYPDATFNLKYFQWMALFALVGDLPNMVFYSKHELSEKQQLARIIIHLILIETMLMVFAKYLGIYETLTQALVMVLIIIGVYVVVRVIDYIGNSKTAKELNERLAEIQKAE